MLILLILSILPKRFLRERRARAGGLPAYGQMPRVSGFGNHRVRVAAPQLWCSGVQAERQNVWTGEQGRVPPKPWRQAVGGRESASGL